jgi:hypothetical protein
MSISNYAENALLDTLGGTAFSVSAPYLQLHVGDPGEDGTTNLATETTRQSVAFTAASGGSLVSTGVVEWTNVSTSETYSHWSMWDASSSGNCLWYGALASTAAVVAGDTFQITSLTLTLD